MAESLVSGKVIYVGAKVYPGELFYLEKMNKVEKNIVIK